MVFLLTDFVSKTTVLSETERNGQWYKTQIGLLKIYHIRVIKYLS